MSDNDRRSEPPRWLRAKKVADLVGLSERHIYRLVRAGTFPKPHRISYKVSVWVESDVVDWQQAQLGALVS